MVKNVEVVVTDTYFNVFSILAEYVKDKASGMTGKNLIFCEEKVSLMAERRILQAVGGSFNTDVYSFGNFLRKKKPDLSALSKEGSAMVVKSVLNSLPLKCLGKSRANLAKPLFELIVQLKSANVSPENLEFSATDSDALLKDKLKDVALVYSAYDEFMQKNGFSDQSIALSELPGIIETDDEIKDSDVYLLGYSSFTAQTRDVIRSLIKSAKSVTAVLTDGGNDCLYLGEAADSIYRICGELGVSVKKRTIDSPLTEEGKLILKSAFDPTFKVKDKISTDRIYISTLKTVKEEVEQVGETIKAAVITRGERYGAFSIALSDATVYKEEIKSVFDKLKIPYFLDEKRKPDASPLITLIYAYCDVWRKNFERSAVISFIKNPLICEDKDFSDAFCGYLIKYSINYSWFKRQFTFGFIDESEKERFEEFRAYLVSLFDRFDVSGLLKKIGAEEKLQKMSARLLELGDREESQENAQIFGAVTRILNDMSKLLGGTKLSVSEWKNVFKSGVSALELSIIPQYSDAVFIGGYKEIGLAKAEYLFMLGLSGDVPPYKEDVALISDKDINRLAEFKVLIEPKIQIVNDRIKENFGLALASFSEKLFLSFSLNTPSGKKNTESEIIGLFKKLFTVKKYEYKNKYLTAEQGLYAFAKACDDFAEQRISDFSVGAAYYKAANSEVSKRVLAYANKTVKTKLSGNRKDLINTVISPTLIETYNKCPYRAFAERIIRVRAEDVGEVDGLTVGTFIHAILENYVNEADGEKYNVKDKESSDAAVNDIASKIIEADEEMKKFTIDPANDAKIDRLIKEAQNVCFKIFCDLKNSKFKPVDTEKDLKVKISNGKYTLVGKVDRVDEYKDYFRIIDYKTGSIDDAEKSLFAGIKLQLYLYASYFEKKSLAGAYYLRAAEKYMREDSKKETLYAGKSLSDKDVLLAQEADLLSSDGSVLPIKRDKDGNFSNVVSKQTMDNYIKYAIKISELAAARMSEGYIPASAYSGECTYCPYGGFCGGESLGERKIKKVDSETFNKIFENEGEENLP